MRCASMSTWKASSSSMRASAARPATRSPRRVRAASNKRFKWILLGFAEDRFESRGESAPVVELLPERAPAGGRDAVVSRAAIVVGRAPLAVDEPRLLEP